jgi:hypothetical protein
MWWRALTVQTRETPPEVVTSVAADPAAEEYRAVGTWDMLARQILP